MRRTRELYEEYRIPPWLQLHQLRVAAVGRMVSENLGDQVDADLVIRTCLLHDIGAIVKFDFTYTTHTQLKDLCPPEDVPHWKEVQDDFRARYGTVEHEASDGILKELGAENVRTLFDELGFDKMGNILASDNVNAQAVQYGDMRVGPYGIVPLQERLADALKRYASFYAKEGRTDAQIRGYVTNGSALEERLFRDAALRPGDITDETAAPVIAELWDYPLA
jgi:hypothetical protein